MLQVSGAALIETVRGEEATRLFLSRTGMARQASGVAFMRELTRHLARFPYENISKIIKNAGSAGPHQSMRFPLEVVDDHFGRNFGGTCFSLTFLLERMLTAPGFDCYKVMADMHMGPNVHCLVIVKECGAKYMIDPGYALYEVIELPTRGRTTVTFPHAVVEIEREEDNRFRLWTEDASGRKWRYGFVDTPVREEDFEGYWIDSFTKPTLNNICLTMMTPQGHIYFRRDFFKFTSRGTISKRRLKDGVESVIREEFGISGEWTELAQRLLMERRHT
ncbi:MAG: arylamine N-acetyltransferase [Candidatus Eisenbacteria bacterium]